MRKAVVILLAIGFAVSAGTLAARAYTLDEVIEACTRAYSSDPQIGQCMANLCSHFGCY
jgi:hypothetical protein